MARRPGEFALIERYLRPLARDPGAFRLTDDAALYRQRPGDDVVVTIDTSSAGVHFFPDDPPDAIAKKALRVNLSDLAAKGAKPFAYLMSLALPDNWTEAWLAKFVKGLGDDQRAFSVSLLGGDTTRAAGGLTIAITALGRVPQGKIVLRSGAKPGDLLFVSGTIGDAALGLRLRQNRASAGRGAKHLRNRLLVPEPRVSIAAAVRRYASAAIDVSDGLIGDLGHICEVSRVGAEVLAQKVPLSPAARSMLAADPSLLSVVLNGGEDYEILAAIPPKAAAAYVRAAKRAGVAITEIGAIGSGKGPPVVRGPDGAAIRLAVGSHTHF